MSQPAPYVPATSFITYQANASWFPGTQLDVEHNNLKTTTDQIRTNLALIQRDDGALSNGSVTYNSLSPALQTAGLQPLSVWVTGTKYAVPQCVIINSTLYQCAIGHTAGVFATDLAAGDWTKLADLTILQSASSVTPNFALIGPASGGAAAPTFRALVGADLPVPAATTLGGVKSLAAVSHQFLTSISTAGVPTQAQPAAADITGLAAVATSGSAADLSAGTLLAARMPALTGDATMTVGTVNTVIANNAVTNAKAAQMAANTVKGNNTGSLANSVDMTVVQTQALLAVGILNFSVSVNFNAGNTDTSIAITLPAGFTRYAVDKVTISGASQTLSTATAGLFTAAAGAGTAIVTGASAITVTSSAEDTANNMQQMTVAGAATQSHNQTTLFWRVATAQGATATGTVTVSIRPVS